MGTLTVVTAGALPFPLSLHRRRVRPSSFRSHLLSQAAGSQDWNELNASDLD